MNIQAGFSVEDAHHHHNDHHSPNSNIGSVAESAYNDLSDDDAEDEMEDPLLQGLSLHFRRHATLRQVQASTEIHINDTPVGNLQLVADATAPDMRTLVALDSNEQMTQSWECRGQEPINKEDATTRMQDSTLSDDTGDGCQDDNALGSLKQQFEFLNEMDGTSRPETIIVSVASNSHDSNSLQEAQQLPSDVLLQPIHKTKIYLAQ